MCKDKKEKYKDLTRRIVKRKSNQVAIGEHRGQGEATNPGVTYWSMAGAETYGYVSAESILAVEMLKRLQKEGRDGVISFPGSWVDFNCGKLEHAMGALSFKM